MPLTSLEKLLVGPADPSKVLDRYFQELLEQNGLVNGTEILSCVNGFTECTHW